MSDVEEVSVLDLWLISGSRVRRGKQDGLPSFSPMASGTFDVAAYGMLLFIPPCNKSHMFLFFETGFLLLRENTVRYVTYEMNDMNANLQNTSQRGRCQAGTGLNALFSAALCIHIKTFLLFVHARCDGTHTHPSIASCEGTRTHTHTHTLLFVPFNSFHHC